MAIEIREETDGPNGAFRAYDDEGAVGSMVFAPGGSKVVVVLHTGVEPRAQGMGVGRQLFDFMVAWARHTGTHIVPRCTFTRKQFLKHPEARDVLR